ncbi:MAG: hypothetical protein KAS92_01110, partial [Candidatus Omnitrophica bacterium]|nr:hypothetical protein [Candidatus Omnitrophota bacterium]
MFDWVHSSLKIVKLKNVKREKWTHAFQLSGDICFCLLLSDGQKHVSPTWKAYVPLFLKEHVSPTWKAYVPLFLKEAFWHKDNIAG